MLFKKNISLYFFLVCAALILGTEIREHLNGNDEGKIATIAQQHLQELEKRMQKSLDEILGFHSEEEFHEYFIHYGFQKSGFSFFYYENEKLNKWSDNDADIPFSLSDSINSPLLIHLSNGWYEAFSKTAGNKKVVGLLLIKKEYAYENNYLLNRFNPKLELPGNAVLASNGSGKYAIQSVAGKKLFSISFPSDITGEENFSSAGWAELIAFVLFLTGILLFFIQRKKYGFVHLVIAVAALLLTRLQMILRQIPNEFYSNAFFSPKYYGSSFFFNSAGDLLLNALTFFCIASLIYIYTRRKSNRTSSQPFLITIILSGMMLLMVAVHSLIAGLIINSKISFDVSGLFNVNGYTIAAVVSIMLLLWSFFFLLYSLLFPFVPLLKRRNLFFVCLIAAIVIQFAGMYGLHFLKSDIQIFQPLPFLLGLILILGTAHLISRKMELTSNAGIAIVFLFAVYSSITISVNQIDKEQETRKLFAQKLDSRQDHLAEYLFEDEERKISGDAAIRQIFTGDKNVNERVSKHLRQFYFSGYLSKFDVTAICYDKNETPFDTASSSLDYFNHQTESQGRSTYCDKLFFMLNETGRLTYLALLPITDSPDTSEQLGTLVLRLEAKLMQSAEGFPDLLVSNRVRSSEAESGYSFARYKNGSLIYAYGNFPYSFSSAAFREAKNDFTFMENEGYDHLIYHASPSALIVVSKAAESSFASVSLFSYILFFFSVIFLVAYFSILLAQKKIKYPPNLKQRIRSSILALVMLSFVFIAAGTIYYITHKYKQDQDKNILSKLNSLWHSLNNNMNVDDSLSTLKKDEWRNNLNSLANNIDDFNLYDENGNLFYSSQPKIFEKGLISERMNPEALFEMSQNERTQYVHPENIGKLNFMSAYSPLTNRNGDITGYANLPFLEKQNELNKEISGFLSALITIYVLLLGLAVVIALIISSRITKPLLLIQEKLSNIHLGRHNESIEWTRKDEIGELVREYNRMIEELAISAEKLSRSERESAWREMAKQVAHEIKNPLTPMKLQLQHLQRALKDDTNLERLKENVERINKLLIEQIDNLSGIATEFSNFANMPRPQNETINLSDILTSSIRLFSGTAGITISFHDDNKERKITADRQQMIRLFANLIKNAMQAIPENREGQINVNMQTPNGFHLVSISDNGTGIPEEQRSKIFTPSFTTKTSGMGLGLAIVKNTAEQAGGKVWFETKEGEGTTFFVELPSV